MAYDRSISKTICERIAEGESLRAVCRDEDMPARQTFLKWVDEDEALADQYARAMEARADAIFDEMFDIADDGKNDWMEAKGEQAIGYQINGEHIQRSKLRIDARKWALARMSPKKYGDKVTNEHTGEGGGPMQFRWMKDGDG